MVLPIHAPLINLLHPLNPHLAKLMIQPIIHIISLPPSTTLNIHPRRTPPLPSINPNNRKPNRLPPPPLNRLQHMRRRTPRRQMRFPTIFELPQGPAMGRRGKRVVRVLSEHEALDWVRGIGEGEDGGEGGEIGGRGVGDGDGWWGRCCG